MDPQKVLKYRPFPPVALKDRRWPDNAISHAPLWCSVDLRDGNQALPVPMTVEEKLELFELLVKIGFKEIEVGFPSAADTEFNFCRRLIEGKLIPEDVTLQVLVQCREHLLRRTFEAIDGAPSAIIHFYNSTNPLQRAVTFGGASREQIKQIAVDAAKLCKELEKTVTGSTKIRYQYSPETFCDTELDFSKEVCEAVLDVIQPTPDDKLILNLPLTVELCTPNVHADQIEWFCRNIKQRDSVIVSLHTHNDRGTGIAATELGLMAGADRVEGTLFGNGERTGNLDIVCVALNMYTQGIDPQLDLSNIQHLRDVYERTTRMSVHERHPYAGDLVFTAFSGSHQDAIKKGLDKMEALIKDGRIEVFDSRRFTPDWPVLPWQVPYLPIDPSDIGSSYQAIIRINNQSGKAGVAFILEQVFGYELPKNMQPEFGAVVNQVADSQSKELSAEEIRDVFFDEYIHRNQPLEIISYKDTTPDDHHHVTLEATIKNHGQLLKIPGSGNGPISAFVNGLENAGLKHAKLLDYRQHMLGDGSRADAVAYIQVQRISDGQFFWGVGIDTNIELAGLKALVSAYNRAEPPAPANPTP